jgi:adenosine deaminase
MRCTTQENAAVAELDPHAPAEPRRRILLVVTGLTPQVVTETLYALWREQPAALPEEVHVLTTAVGAERARLALLSEHPGWFARLCTDHGLPPIAFDEAHIHTLTSAGGDTLQDIRSAGDNAAAADQIAEFVRRLTADPATALHVSLAGGRKTMSADLQDAAATFGAAAWLHVVGPEPLPAELRDGAIDTFLGPLPAAVAGAVTPVVVGAGTRSEWLDIELDGQRIDVATFPLPLAPPQRPLHWSAGDGGAPLGDALARRQRESRRLLGNFVARLAETDAYENWSTLYRLPAGQIDRLRAQPVGDFGREWLRQLPKADLHRHLGGCLDIAAQQRVAQAVWDALPGAERDAAMRQAAPLLEPTPAWPADWPARLRGPRRTAASAAVLLHLPPQRLEAELYGSTEPRYALKRRSAMGFAAYERPGELSGSALLSHPAAISPYAQALVAQAREEGLLYLELRGSPHKYRPDDPGAFLVELDAALRAAGAQTRGFDATHAGPRIGFVWILDRRRRESIGPTVGRAVAAREQLPGFVLGLDLAGDEGTQSPQELAPLFAPAFEACMPVTIHAGEGESAQNIWQAAYHLHADRIGHGLSLADHPALMQRFRDRGIALELCPSSNREVVGFRDSAHPATAAEPDYPLPRFVEAGLPLALCTDNPGISRTTLADEFLAAARMSRSSLTAWQALAIVRMSFRHAFAPAAERDALRRRAERSLHALLSDLGSAATDRVSAPLARR